MTVVAGRHARDYESGRLLFQVPKGAFHAFCRRIFLADALN